MWAGKLHCHHGPTRQSIVCLVPAASFAGNTETNFVTGFSCGSPTLTSTAPIVAPDLLLFVSIAAGPDWPSLWFSLSVTSCGSIRGGGHLRWGIRGAVRLFLCLVVVVVVQVCGLVQSGVGGEQAGKRDLPPGVDIHQILAPAVPLLHHASSLFRRSNWKSAETKANRVRGCY